MEREQQIKELQEKIEKLSKNIYLFHQELQSLRAELNALRGKPVHAPYNRSIDEQKLPIITDSNTGLENYIGLRFMHIIGIVVLVGEW